MSDTVNVIAHRVAGFAPGEVVPIEVDETGIPLALEWRRRLRDAERDGCCEVEKEAPELDEGPEAFTETQEHYEEQS